MAVDIDQMRKSPGEDPLHVEAVHQPTGGNLQQRIGIEESR